MTVRSVGVEEELLLVEPGTGQPRAVAEAALRGIRDRTADGRGRGPRTTRRRSRWTSSCSCSSWKPTPGRARELGELGRELRRCRALAAEVAARAGAQVAALATSPVPVVPELVREGRYLAMARAFGLTAHEQLTCGCHVHVEISSAGGGGGGARPDQAVAGRSCWRSARTRRSGRGATARTPASGTRRGAAGRPPGRRTPSAPPRPTGRRCGRWSAPARCSTPAWCTSTPGCPSTTRRWRSGSPTCACTPTTRC